MSSNGFATGLQFEPGPSAWMPRLLLSFYLLVATGLLLTGPSLTVLAGMLLLPLLWSRERHERRLPQWISRDADGAWWLDEAGPFTLQPATFVGSRLVVLNLHNAAGTRRLALPVDSLPPHQWRHLRVILRIDPAID